MVQIKITTFLVSSSTWQRKERILPTVFNWEAQFGSFFQGLDLDNKYTYSYASYRCYVIKASGNVFPFDCSLVFIAKNHRHCASKYVTKPFQILSKCCGKQAQPYYAPKNSCCSKNRWFSKSFLITSMKKKN